MIKRNKFSLSHHKLFSMNMGSLVPLGWTEVLPGDTIQAATSALVRATPLLAPVMHPVDVSIHHWFVPNRLVMDDWESFITGGEDGADSTTFPTININPTSGTLADYLGVPCGTAVDVNALPFRAYAHIWNEHYRDQDLQTALTIDTTDGADSTTSTSLQNVCWEKDYFTSSRPWTQKGSEVSLPLGSTAYVESAATVGSDVLKTRTTDDDKWYDMYTSAGNKLYLENTTGVSSPTDGSLYADLSSATAASISDLREAIGLQKFAEARARYGARFSEYLRYLGVTAQDSRLQRPEYLGGGKQTLQFSEVIQTGVTTSGSEDGPGNLKGHGIAAMRSNRFRRFFGEHGVMMTLMSVRPKTIYADGLSKKWSRTTKEDYWQKELQHIGQAEVYNREIYTAHASPSGVFGYQDRYDEYRRQESGIAGDFRDAAYDHWHCARLFSSDPALNSTFVSCNPAQRIFASTATDTLYVMANQSIQARRLVAKTGTPGGL